MAPSNPTIEQISKLFLRHEVFTRLNTTSFQACSKVNNFRTSIQFLTGAQIRLEGISKSLSGSMQP